MKFASAIFLIVVLFIASTRLAWSQSFVNLDFEDATIAPTPVGGSTYPANPAQAFPGWNVAGGGGNLAVMYNTLSLGAPAVSLMGPDFPNGAGFIPLQGSYSTALYYQNLGFFAPPTLSQTAFVPADAQSISFLVGNGQSDAVVLLNGINISLIPVFGGRLTGDISAFAGSVATLTFTTTSRMGGNFLYFDDIQFSSLPVPEPSTLALGALGALLAGSRRWRNFSR